MANDMIFMIIKSLMSLLVSVVIPHWLSLNADPPAKHALCNRNTSNLENLACFVSHPNSATISDNVFAGFESL